METKEIQKIFKDKPYLYTMGSNTVAKRLKCSVEEIRRIKKENQKSKLLFREQSKFPKILIMDIETAPLKAYIWKRWKENISLDQTISEWFMFCWSAKWLFSAETMSNCVTPKESLNEDDSRIVKSLWKLIDEADIIITHNGDRFDIPKMNSRFLLAGLPPTTSYFSIDTKKISCTQFGFSSNKLDALAGYFGIEHKLDTNFNLWKRCLEGDKEALNYMETYNKKDVEILEEVYLKLRPWIKNHPNIGNFLELDTPVCSNCGHTEVDKLEDKYYYTSVGKYSIYRCPKCGAMSRGRKTLKDSKLNKNLIVSVRK